MSDNLTSCKEARRADGSIVLMHESGPSAGTAMLVPCKFETDILGRATFRLDVAKVGPAAPQLITAAMRTAQASGARLVTCRVPEHERQILSALQSAGFRVIECLMTLRRALSDRSEELPPAVRLAGSADAAAIAAIAECAFLHDRFHADPMIADDSANRLKAAWAYNSAMGRGDAVFVTEQAGQVTGFNACLRRDDTAIIDLIAIKPDFQGLGLGRALVDASLAHYAGKASSMMVGTQSANHASLALYQSCGFKIVASAVTLHAHLN